MYVCRLFESSNPFEQIDARIITQPLTTIGRDESADWPIGVDDGSLSRIHCTLVLEHGRLFLCDHSKNGTFLDDTERLPHDERVELGLRQSFHMGAFSVLVDQPMTISDGPASETVLALPYAPVPSDWTDQPINTPTHRDASLLEAFCEGARLDASAFSSEDPVELMNRLGALYQQTVLGLASLMAERARMKAVYALDRTTISASDNNPFKWAHSRKLAQDLLCHSDQGFLPAGEAVRASFDDLARHMAAVAAGANASVSFALKALSPAAIEAEAQPSLLRSKPQVCWETHLRRHAAVAAEGGQGSARQVFADAYVRAVQ